MKNQNLTTFLEVITENPDLPIVPMVGTEVVADDSYGYWAGSWGTVRIDEYIVTGEHITFKGDEDPYDIMCNFADEEELLQKTDDEIKAAYNALPWVKAIIVHINPPEI